MDNQQLHVPAQCLELYHSVLFTFTTSVDLFIHAKNLDHLYTMPAYMPYDSSEDSSNQPVVVPWDPLDAPLTPKHC